MKKIILMSLLLGITLNGYAATEKQKFCPTLGQIKFERLSSQNFIYKATNFEGQMFSSEIMNEKVNIFMLSSSLTNYNSTEKKLTCVYFDYPRTPQGPYHYVHLVNTGSY